MKVKLAYLGAGSLFVPSIINGLAQVMRESKGAFEVNLVLYDIHPDKAKPMRAYAEVVRKAWKVALQASVVQSRIEALADADMVLLSAGLTAEHQWVDNLWERLGFRLPAEGPGLAAAAVACAPWSLAIAAEMRQSCPNAFLLTLMNPTDILAGLLAEAAGVSTAGLCVEVDGLRGVLAYHFGVPYESIGLRHAGVNHDGWVLELSVNDQDGYQLWAGRWQELSCNPDRHPGTHGVWPILSLTRYLRSSAYHNWPYTVPESSENNALWEKWRDKRETYSAALNEAIRTGQPITDPPGIHPEHSKLNYPYTGLTVGKLLQSVATGQANIIPLQVPNRGAITNFPDNVIVEVPTRVQGRQIQGLPVGELPEWLGGYTRLLAIQRRLILDYLLDRQLVTLKRALVTLPMFGTVQQLDQFADALHRLFLSNKFGCGCAAL